MEVFLQELEHPDYGTVRVFWRWVKMSPWSWSISPVAIEFDLFTPDSEKRALLDMLDLVRIDRSVSVSATEDRGQSYE